MQDKKTRAEWLAECQAAGLKATGWKKERMISELEKLGTQGEASGEPDSSPASEGPEGQEAAERPEPSGPSPVIRSGWCISNQHADGRPMRWGNPCPVETCPCWCHLPADPKNLADHRVVPREPVQADAL